MNIIAHLVNDGDTKLNFADEDDFLIMFSFWVIRNLKVMQ